jgi:hypothetical protein
MSGVTLWHIAQFVANTLAPSTWAAWAVSDGLARTRQSGSAACKVFMGRIGVGSTDYGGIAAASRIIRVILCR